MKKLPQSNAPSAMLQWIREVVSILSSHDSDIATLKSESSISKASAGLPNRVSVLETKQGTQARVIWSGQLSLTTATANTAVSGILTFPDGLFSATPIITATPSSTANLGSSVAVQINNTNTNASQVEIYMLASTTGARTINVVAVQN